MPIVEARDLSKRFILRHNPSGSLKVHFLGLFHRGHKEQREDFWALRDVSLRIGRGESIGLIGRNGSGKSTLLKLIAAIHTPTSGKLLVERGVRIGTMIELGSGISSRADRHGERRPECRDLRPVERRDRRRSTRRSCSIPGSRISWTCR